MQQDTDGGEVFDTYGRRVGVVGDRSGAVRLDLGLADLLLTPEIWDDLDRRVRASFRPELLDVETYEDVPLRRARELLEATGLPDASVTSVLAVARKSPGEPAELVQGSELAVSAVYDNKARKYTVVIAS